jgi:hypothetical protein
MQWPTAGFSAGLIATPGGGFSVFTPNAILAFGADLHVRASLSNPLGRGEGEWFAYASPAGRFVLLDRDGSRVLIGTDPPRELGLEPSQKGLAPLDNGDLVDVDLRSGRPEIERADGGSQVLLFPVLTGGCGWPTNYYAINPNQIFGYSFGAYPCAALYSNTPGIAFQRNLNKNDFIGPVAVSADGTRFAVAYNHASGSFMDMGVAKAKLQEIEVYEDGKTVLKLKGSDLHITRLQGMALSGHGDRLALITESNQLEVFEVNRERAMKPQAPGATDSSDRM